jgi:hypothetical protein
MYASASSKAEAVARMYCLAGWDVEPLGPGSKEKRSALEALATVVGLDLSSQPGKSECGAMIAHELQVEWDGSCFSSGDTITLIGLNRLVDAAVAWLAESDPNDTTLVDDVMNVPPAPRAGGSSKGSGTMSEDLVEHELNAAELIARLSQPGETPEGVRGAPEVVTPEDVRFDDGRWRDRLAMVQDWLHLPAGLDRTSSAAFDTSVADALMLDAGHDRTALATLLPRLVERLERALALREAFADEMESAAEGGATRTTATQHWIESWDETTDEDEADSGAPIHAAAKTWSITQFAYYATSGQLELSPSYQRADVWPNQDAQMLIESVLRGVPLPSIILLEMAGDRGASYEVVDGKQRLTSILRFIGRHPSAIRTVKQKAVAWGQPDLLEVFQTDYPHFRRLWKEYEPSTLTAQKERELYFPFKVRPNAPLSGDLATLKGKYYSQIRNERISVVGIQHPVLEVFELQSDYQVPVIVYVKVTTDQIHEVFKLYNKQGKHLNAEEIRNAQYHRLDLMRALLVTAGDADDVGAVAPFLLDDWHDLSSTPTTLDDYGFGRAGYKRTKLLSWVASVLFLDKGRPESRSTARQINALLDRVDGQPRDRFRSKPAITAAMLLLDHGLDAHAGAAADIWAQSFRNAQSRGKWQELQLVASLIGLCAARAVVADELDDLLDERAEEVRAASEGWRRPSKTQSREQWIFIAHVVGDLLAILGVDADEAHERIARQFGESGLGSLLDVARRA